MTEMHQCDLSLDDSWGVTGGLDRRPSVKAGCIFMRRECSLLYDTL